MKRTYLIITGIVLGIVLLYSCQHEMQWPAAGTPGTDTLPKPPTNTPPPIPTGGNGCSADSVYFSNTILPLLTSNCAMSGCHNGLSGGDAGEYTLNTYAGIRSIVVPGNPGNSKLVEVIASGQMPPYGHTPISADQLATIEKWISQGARNNSCTANSCDTSHVTYSSSITSIMQGYCTGCHSGSAPSGGVDLTTYAGVNAQVQNGKLWGDVSHSTGFNAMPLGGAMLPACELNIINTWIHNGAPNN